MRTIYPKQLINDLLVKEIKEIIPKHPYLSFALICSGIEFLGKCIDSKSNWDTKGNSKKHFTNAIEKLFPKHYEEIKNELYKELRCGLLHSQISGSFRLTEINNDPIGILQYQNHLKNDKSIIVIEYFFFDFVQACKKIIEMKFDSENKMNKPIIYVGPLN